MHERDQVASPKLPEELARDQRGDRPAGAGGVARARALQRSAGNRSVSALLARDPDDPQPLDSKTPDPPKSTTGGLATLEGIGSIPLISVTSGTPGGSFGFGGGGATGRSTPKQLSCTSTVGEHSTKLNQAVVNGTSMTADVLIGPALHLTLTGAMVSSYTASGAGGDAPTESWSLVFESSKQV